MLHFQTCLYFGIHCSVFVIVYFMFMSIFHKKYEIVMEILVKLKICGALIASWILLYTLINQLRFTGNEVA